MTKLKSISNDDKRTPLPPGTVIQDGYGLGYTIKDSAVSVGGSGLIYRVRREGTLRNIVLKECYPRSSDSCFIRKDYVVCAENADSQKEFDLVKRNMRRESEIAQLLSRITGRIIGAWETLTAPKIIADGKVFDAQESCFVVMEQAADDENKRGWFLSDLLKVCAKPVQDNAPLQNGGLPSPYVATCIVEELVKSLRDIHAAGYIHGDINDGNLYLLGADVVRGEVGLGQLLDFGNALELDATGKTALAEEIFSTDSYGAPEIFERTGAIQLTRAADIFSVGCLMIYLLKGFAFKKIYNRKILSDFSVDTHIPLQAVMKRGYRRESATVFRKILARAMRRDPSERFQTAKDMLNEIAFLKKILQPPKFSLPMNLSRSPYFVKGSRDKELAALQHALDEGASMSIFGTGGEGKTTLAMEFARMQIERGRFAFLVTFNGESLRETIMSLNFSGWQFEYVGKENAEEEEYQARLNLLRENYEDALMIIDNFDSETQTPAELQSSPAYFDLLSLNMKILFTTRSRPEETANLELKPLSEEDCLKLFKAVAKFSPEDEPVVRKLIREVDSHAMTVEMLARTISRSWGTLSPKELLDLLRSQKLSGAELPEIMHRKGFTEREATLYGHLRTLFKLVYSDEYRDILCDLTLIPPDGFDAGEFLVCMDGAKKNI